MKFYLQGLEILARNPQSKDESLEAIDFIVNVLKEHEKDLDTLIGELATATRQFGETGELNGKVKKVEEKVNNLQTEVANLSTHLSGAQKKTPPATVKEQAANATTASMVQNGPNIILGCKQWEDFQTLAFLAQTLSFSYKDDEKVFKADAIKGNQIITYSGAIPKFSAILKVWLSKELGVPENLIFEGVLAIR
jgi:hypothetical protein